MAIVEPEPRCRDQNGPVGSMSRACAFEESQQCGGEKVEEPHGGRAGRCCLLCRQNQQSDGPELFRGTLKAFKPLCFGPRRSNGGGALREWPRPTFRDAKPHSFSSGCGWEAG